LSRISVLEKQFGANKVVAVAENVRSNADFFPNDSLDGKTSFVNLWGERFDDDSLVIVIFRHKTLLILYEVFVKLLFDFPAMAGGHCIPC
jgi:hypothetical protein